jgi:CheY-like chemotaxis protein
MPLLVVAEDDEDIRALLVRRLARRGWEVAEAADGAAALELIRERRPALAILDSSMPHMTGEEVAAAVRADPATAAIPVIVLTAHGAGELAPGVDARLGKPFQIDEVDATVRRLIG